MEFVQVFGVGLLMLLGAVAVLVMIAAIGIGIRDRIDAGRREDERLHGLLQLEAKVLTADRWLTEFSVVSDVTSWIIRRKGYEQSIDDFRSRLRRKYGDLGPDGFGSG